MFAYFAAEVKNVLNAGQKGETNKKTQRTTHRANNGVQVKDPHLLRHQNLVTVNSEINVILLIFGASWHQGIEIVLAFLAG